MPISVKGFFPQREILLILPGIKAGAFLPGAVNHFGQAPVAARQPGFEHGLAPSVQLSLSPGPRSSRLSSCCLASICLSVSQGTHWKGVCGLGTKVLTPACSLTLLPATLRPFGDDRFAQVGDSLHVFQGFGGVSDHEIELDGQPAAAVDFAGGIEQRLG
jgi:hypothetical protein